MENYDLNNLTLADIHPSQFYISQKKIDGILLWFQKDDLSNFEPILIKLLNGIPVITDGHTRAVVAIKSGLTKVPLRWDEDEMDWEMYQRCVDTCKEKGISTPYDLVDCIVSAEEYKLLWIDWCDKMHDEV